MHEVWCLHGALGTAGDWKPFAHAMAGAGGETRSVDLWRYLECCPMPLMEFGRVLNAECRGLGRTGERRPVLLGYSMGARLALHALLDEDPPWRAAVIVGAHPGLETEAERIARREHDAEWGARALSGDWREFLDAWNAQPVLADSSVRAEPPLFRRREIARSFVDWSLGAQEPLWDELPAIRIPVLWVCGERDAKFRALGERAVSRIPGAELAVIEGAGHRVPWDQPDAFARRVREFLHLDCCDSSQP
jgi:2-succinyl-6-hydroxy-2,4-cyclohexadiene-1-carboxylate synthase